MANEQLRTVELIPTNYDQSIFTKKRPSLGEPAVQS